MREALSESPHRGEWCSPHRYKFNISASAESEAGSKEIFRVRPAEFISPNKPIFGLVKGRLCICWVCKGKMASLLEPHNEFYPKFFMYPELSRVGLLGVRIVG